MPLAEQLCAAEAGGVEGGDQRPDQHIFAHVMQTAKARRGQLGIVQFEMQSARQALHLADAVAGDEVGLGAQGKAAGEARVGVENGSQLLQRCAESLLELHGPADAGALLWNAGDMLVVNVQIAQAVADVQARAVGKFDLLMADADGNAHDAIEIGVELEDALAAAKVCIEPADDCGKRPARRGICRSVYSL